MAYLNDLEDPNRVGVYSADGRFGTVTKDELDIYIKQGFRLAAPSEVSKEREKLIYGEKDIQAGVLGAARGLSLGLSDVALTKTGLYEPEELRKIEQHNPAASTAGEIGGVLGSFALGGLGAVGKGAQVAKAATTATNAGKLAKLFKGAQTATAVPRVITDTTKSITAGIGNKLAREASQAALEGVVYGGGHLISKAAMEDPNLNAEYAALTLGLGAAAGAAVPLGMAGLGKGLSAAGEKMRLTHYKPTSFDAIKSKSASEIESTYITAYQPRADKLAKKYEKNVHRAMARKGQEPVGGIQVVTTVVPHNDPMKGDGLRVLTEFVQEYVDKTNPNSRPTETLFSWERLFRRDSLEQLTNIKNESFSRELKGIQRAFGEKVEWPILQQLGYVGKKVETVATNIVSAKNFATGVKNPKFQFQDLVASQRDIKNNYDKDVTITEILDAIQGKRSDIPVPTSLDKRGLNIKMSGLVPSPPSIFKKITGVLGQKLTGVDAHVLFNFMDDPKLQQLLQEPNMARRTASEMAIAADLYNENFHKLTELIVGKNKARQWDRMMRPTEADLPVTPGVFPSAEETASLLIRESERRYDEAFKKVNGDLETLRDQLGAMIDAGPGEYGYVADLRRLKKTVESKMAAIAKNEQADISPLGNLYYQVDNLKRDVGKFVTKNMRKRNTISADDATMYVLAGEDGKGGLYQYLRETLEDENLFFKAARVQKDINKSWVEFLELNNFQGAPKFFVPMGKDGFFDNYKADQDAFERLLSNVAEGRSPLATEYFERWGEGSLNLINTIRNEMVNNDVYGSWKKAFQETIQDISKAKKAGLAPDTDWEVLQKQKMLNWLKKNIDKETEGSFLEKDEFIRMFEEQQDIFEVLNMVDLASAWFIPFISQQEKRAAINVLADYKGFSLKTPGSFSPSDFLQATRIKQAAKEARQNQDLAVPAGVVGAVGGGLGAGAVAGVGVGAAQQVAKTFTNPETLIRRYQAIKSGADALGNFTKKAVETTGKVASTTLQAFQPAFVPAAALYSANELHQHLTNKEMEKDEDLYTTLSDIMRNPSNAAERIADNLADYAGVDDEVANALAGRTMEQLVFLHGKMDAMMTRPAGLKDKPMRLSAFNRNKLNRYINALQDPMSVLSVIKAGKKPSRESLEVMQQFYPDIYQQILMVLSGNGDKKALEHVGGAGSVSIGRVQAIYAQPQQQEQQGQQGQGIATPQPLAAQRLATGRIGR